MDRVAKTIHLTADDDIWIGYVDQATGDYVHVIINTNQLVLLAKQAMEIISRCSIVRPVP